MDLNQIMAMEVRKVLDEATDLTTNRLIIESLLKNGKVTIEEATFLNKLATEVIEEAAEEFIPDTIEVEEATKEAAPVVEEATKEEAPVVEEATKEAAPVVEEATKEEAPVVEEATKEEAPVVEEATKEEAPVVEELTESEAIVNNLINKLF